jgi:hypothetical protein
MPAYQTDTSHVKPGYGSEDLQGLGTLDPACHAEAIDLFARGEIERFLVCVTETEFTCHRGLHGLRVVLQNAALLKRRGFYERALLCAYTEGRGSHYQVPLGLIRGWFTSCDRARLRAAGEPLPGPGPWRVYRGVAGMRQHRHVRGVSWTLNQERARWFAHRWGLYDPAVLSLVVSERKVLAYTNARQEQEFLLLLNGNHRPQRVG